MVEPPTAAAAAAEAFLTGALSAAAAHESSNSRGLVSQSTFDVAAGISSTTFLMPGIEPELVLGGLPAEPEIGLGELLGSEGGGVDTGGVGTEDEGAHSPPLTRWQPGPNIHGL